MLKNITHHCLPPSNEGKDKCMNLGWNLTFNENHSSTLDTTKQFVHDILLPYLHIQICHLGLHESQKMVWLLDCWSMNEGHDFLDWMKETHPNILILLPYLHTQICHLGLHESQKMVWLLDCWSMNKGHDFLDWMKETHPNILVVFIPTSYINVLQPMDVILQWSLKHAVKI